MSAARVIVGVGVLGLAAWAVVAYARAGQAIGPDAPVADAGWLDGLYAGFGGGEDAQDIGYIDPINQAWLSLTAEVQELTDMNTQPGYVGSANVAAFLDVLKRCEGTANADDPYRVCYAYRHTIQSFTDHPALTGEWRGEPLTAQQCAGAGFGPGCVSTAAGAFQITRPTWKRVREKLGLPDFGPQSQQAAAVQLLRECGAYSALMAGDLAGAVNRARRTWASLPGANYAGQGMRSMEQVAGWYGAAGGGTA